MPSIHLQLAQQLDTKTRELAKKLNLNRSAYIRNALDEYNSRMERELLASQFEKASLKCREESMQVCGEFEALEDESESF